MGKVEVDGGPGFLYFFFFFWVGERLNPTGEVPPSTFSNGGPCKDLAKT